MYYCVHVRCAKRNTIRSATDQNRQNGVYTNSIWHRLHVIRYLLIRDGSLRETPLERHVRAHESLGEEIVNKKKKKNANDH